MELKKKGRKPLNLVAFNKIVAAKKAEVFISRKEWKLVTPPGAHILRKYLKMEYKVQSLANNKGWVIKRVR